MFREHEGTVQITPYGSGFGPSDELADPGSFSRLPYCSGEVLRLVKSSTPYFVPLANRN